MKYVVIHCDPLPDAREEMQNTLARKFAAGEITHSQYELFSDYVKRYLGITSYKKVSELQ